MEENEEGKRYIYIYVERERKRERGHTWFFNNGTLIPALSEHFFFFFFFFFHLILQSTRYLRVSRSKRPIEHVENTSLRDDESETILRYKRPCLVAAAVAVAATATTTCSTDRHLPSLSFAARHAAHVFRRGFFPNPFNRSP